MQTITNKSVMSKDIIIELESIGLKFSAVAKETGIPQDKFYNVKRGSSKFSMVEVQAIRRHLNSLQENVTMVKEPVAKYSSKKELYNIEVLIDTVWDLRARLQKLEDEKE